MNERPSEGEGLEVHHARRSGRRDELVQLLGSEQDYGALVRRALPLDDDTAAGKTSCRTRSSPTAAGRSPAGCKWHQGSHRGHNLARRLHEQAGAGAEQRRDDWKRRQTLVRTRDRVLGV